MIKELGAQPFPMRGDPYEYVPCDLRQPEGETQELMYDLYYFAGRPYSGDQKGCISYSCYTPTVSSTRLNFGFCYDGGDVDDYGVPWEVPQWAIAIAQDIRGLVNRAEHIGREDGHNWGLASGKAFVKQLAAGNMSVTDFNDADGRDSGRLTPKKWGKSGR